MNPNTHARRPQKDNTLYSSYKGQSSQFFDLPSFNTGLKFKVEFIESLAVGKSSQLQARFQPFLLALLFRGQEFVEKLEIGLLIVQRDFQLCV